MTLGQHEPAAALIIDGRCVALCEEERYLRIKSCYGMLPDHAIKACLDIAGISFADIDLVVTPGITYPGHAERISAYLRHNFGSCPKVGLVHHQTAHVNAAFYGSGKDKAICLSLDASGDGTSGMLARASRTSGIKVLEEIPIQNSLGFFYTMMTYFLGFSDGDEYKVMGLAPYGEPSIDLTRIIRPTSGGWQFDWSFIRQDPPIRSPFEPLYDNRLADALGRPNRVPGSEVTPYHRDLARSVQAAMEECLLSLLRAARSQAPDLDDLCYAGGVALNCSANKRIVDEAGFNSFYVSPVSSDRGLALGCAYHGAVLSGDTPEKIDDPYLGSSYSADAIRGELESNGCTYQELEDPAETAAELLADGKVLGWFQGRSEAGARALGNRSIISAASTEEMRDLVNARIKYREEFRPFAPAALVEQADDYFDTKDLEYPTMSITVDARPATADRIRAVVHTDGTARLQTVDSRTNARFHELIQHYDRKTGVPVILNTSFNLKGQPIVESPRDAIMTFFACGLDALILDRFLVKKIATQ